MQSTGSERRGLTVLLSIIAILIVTALLTNYIRSRNSETVTAADTSVQVISAQPDKQLRHPDTTATTAKRRRSNAKPTRTQNQRQYRQRDFYEETLDR